MIYDKNNFIIGSFRLLIYAFFQRNKSRLVAGGISVLSLIGMIFVVKPDLASAVANMVGVGRGADLILYFWIMFSVLVMMSLQFKHVFIATHLDLNSRVSMRLRQRNDQRLVPSHNKLRTKVS